VLPPDKLKTIHRTDSSLNSTIGTDRKRQKPASHVFDTMLLVTLRNKLKLLLSIKSVPSLYQHNGLAQMRRTAKSLSKQSKDNNSYQSKLL
jgi:hypothetical protein